MSVNNICIDISNAVPGKGGTGGGISTYAINLIKNLDNNLDNNSPTIYCIKNKELTTLGNLKNIIIKDITVNNSNLISRLFWLHVKLPVFCLIKKIHVLHRIVPELPALKVCNYIITMHDFMFEFYLQSSHLKKYLSGAELSKFKMFRKFSHMAVKIADGIIVPADTVKNQLKNKFQLKNKKVIAIYEASEYSFSEMPLKQKTNVLNIGVVAGFYPHKGHLKVLELASQFLNFGFSDFRIYMRGSKVFKSYVEDIEAKIITLNLQDFVEFEPFVSKITLEEIYAKFDLVLLLSEYEGFGLPVLEAQSMSIPVVCSDIPIFREILQDSVFYVDSNLSQSAISSLLKEISFEGITNEKVKKGRKNILRFSWNRMSIETLSLYRVFLSN